LLVEYPKNTKLKTCRGGSQTLPYKINANDVPDEYKIRRLKFQLVQGFLGRSESRIMG
jgi:hypothetical protein